MIYLIVFIYKLIIEILLEYEKKSFLYYFF